MKVSVIVPVRNEGPRVAVTFDALFAQTRLPDEIVVADGGSTDDTVARIRAYADRGVPLTIVDNPTVYAGGGRNAATLAASHDLLVNLDVGNRPDERWLEAIVRPFEEDPTLDYVGGIYYPMIETWFERASGAIIYFDDCLGMTWSREELERHVPPDPTPGGNCMAYRRAIWARAGGFCEWARKGQDRLFGQRIRNVGGRIAMTLDSIMHHHMAGSVREIFDRHYHYGLWIGRMALDSSRFSTLSKVYAAGIALVLAAFVWPRLAWLVPIAIAAYVYVAAWRKLDTLVAATGRPFSARERLWAILIVFLRDGATLTGTVRGKLERRVDPRWRRMTAAYLDEGRQPATPTCTGRPG